MTADSLDCRRQVWRGRQGCLLGNEVIELIHLTGGGQIPDIHFRGDLATNPFWIPRWKLREPMRFRRERDEARYGARVTGKLLSAIAGHSLCVAVFGMPSEEEIHAGAVLHGEAGVRRWKADLTKRGDRAEIRFSLRLSRSGLLFTRKVSLRRNESVVRVEETVKNLLGTDQLIQWQQHATLGPPFLSRDHSSITIPGIKAMTDPNRYENCGLLASGMEFDWPNAAAAHGGTVNLQAPFQVPGTGFVAGVQVDPRRDHGFVCAVNHVQDVAFGYLFSRADFPWVAVWEENCARSAVPWRGMEQARALEFGVSPLPLGRAETMRRGDLFGIPTMARVPAGGEIRASYIMFLSRLTGGEKRIGDVACREDVIELLGYSGKSLGTLVAQGIQEFLARRGASQ